MNKIFIIGATLLMLASRSYSCDCLAPSPPMEALKNADAVFLGKVISGRIIEKDKAEYVFKVKEKFKGNFTRKVTVTTGDTSISSCGISFLLGAEYLVYANGKKELETHLCSRTKMHPKDGELSELRSGKSP